MWKAKAIKLAEKFGIEVIEDSKEPFGTCDVFKKTITVNPKKATSYTVLHEVGHALFGYGCCREHDEYIAHGIAIGLAKASDIRLPRNHKGLIDAYAGRTEHNCCVAIEKKLKKKKRVENANKHPRK